MLAQVCLKSQRSNINSKLQFSMSLSDQYVYRVVTTRSAFKYPWCFLLLIVYLSAAAHISVENGWGSCWHINILRVKGQALIKNSNFLSVCVTKYELWNGCYLVRHHVSMVFLRLTVYQSAAGCISGGTKVGYMLEQ